MDRRTGLPNLSRDDPPSSCEAVARLRLRLRDRSLAQLEAEGLVIYDRDNDIVRKGPDFDATQVL